MFRERVAVAFITAAGLFSLVFGFLVVQELTQPRAAAQVAVAGGSQDSGAASDAASPGTTDSTSPGASANPGSASNPGGSSTTTTTGGNSTAANPGGKTLSHGAVATDQQKSGVSSGSILVGGIFDETGAVDSSVERDTVRAYFSKINAQGGINGRKLTLEDCDSGYDTNLAHSCSTKMVSDNVLAIVGWTAPKGEDNEVPYLSQQGVPMIGGLGTPNEYATPLSFPVSVPFTRYGKGIAELFSRNAAAANGVGFKHPAIIYINDVPWVATVKQALLDALHAKGIYETHTEAAASTDGDYGNHVAALQHSGDGPGQCPNQPNCPDSLIAALDPYSYVKLFHSMDLTAWRPPVVAGGLDKGSFQKDYGDQLDMAQSLVPFLSPYDNGTNPTVSDYITQVQKYYPGQVSKLDIYTQHSWTAAQIFVEAVRRAGKDLNRKSLVDALNSIQNFDTGWSKPLSYAPGNHDPNHCFRYMKHDSQDAGSGGSWKTVSDWVCF
ncbi:MAG: ABC transporter substrate-binding protein [Candidatus Dormibacteria bacterium]